MSRPVDVVIIGGSGHAKVVLEIFLCLDSYRVVGLVDPNIRGEVLGVPILGGDDLLLPMYERGLRHVFVAVGDNRLRQRITTRVRSQGFLVPAAISPRANVSGTARIGEGAAVMGGVTINADARVGPGAIVNTNASIDHDCVIGAFAHCAPGTHLAGGVYVDEGAFLGVGVSAIPNVRIGAWSLVGAGAAVTADLPAGIVAVGVPARERRANTALERRE
jgi:UDP-perosamine 4-acetyltransferase